MWHKQVLGGYRHVFKSNSICKSHKIDTYKILTVLSSLARRGNWVVSCTVHLETLISTRFCGILETRKVANLWRIFSKFYVLFI